MPRRSPEHRIAMCLSALALGLTGVAGVPASAPAASGKAKDKPTPVTLSPAPGARAAAPATQISVLGIAPSRIRDVRVAGARSGAHAGRLAPYSGGRGASFLPSTPFLAGERVTATVRFTDRPQVRSTFTVARQAPLQPVLNLPVTQPDKLQRFVSMPGLQPPKIAVLKGASAAGDAMFLTPLPSPIIHPGSTTTVTIKPVGPGGPMIVDGRGQLVWFRQLAPPNVAANLDVQRYRGQRVLTWWEGPVTTAAYGLGEAVIADSSYRTVARVRTGNGYKMDIHELRLDGDDALVTIYSPILVHLPGTPAGKLSPLLDSVVQQIDVRTGLVVWEWHAYDGIPLADSYATTENSATNDAFHINSVQPLSGGRLLISARNASAIYAVHRSTGRIDWTLGGKNSSFRLGPGARFWFQHDARMLPGNRVSLFDDEGGPPQKAPASRGLVLQLDHKRRRATVAQAYERAPDTSAQSEGSTQTLPSGNVFVGFGSAPFFSEFTAKGRLVFDARLPEGDGSYRVMRYPWAATPRTRPTVVVQRSDATHATAYASWNGATAVARWQVLAGPGPDALAPVASAARTGFETAVPVAGAATTFAVRALAANGRVLATSTPVPAS